MPKRKRVSSNSDQNPFLPEKLSEDDVLGHVRTFFDGSSDKELSDDVRVAVTAMLEAVDSSPKQSDLVRLLVPWGIQRFLSSDEPLARQCLMVGACLAGDDILNSSTIMKLLKRIASLSDHPENRELFALLLRNRFRPTLEVACRQVLVPTVQNGKDAAIIREVLELLLKLVPRGNPKTAFQLMASPEMLLSLARAGHPDLVYAILDQALFAHQLDGFKSALNARMNEGSFRCYQEDFFATIDKLMADDDARDDALRLFPHLLRSYFERTKDNPQTMLVSCFTFFQYLADSLLGRCKDTPPVVITATYHQMLTLLLEWNIYVPSLDKERQQFTVLERLTNFLRTTEGALPACKVLLQLDHRLVADCWSDIAYMHLRETELVTDFLDAVLESYSKLRQEATAVEGLLHMLSTCRLMGSEARDVSDNLQTVIHRLPTATFMTHAPMSQVKIIFDAFSNTVPSFGGTDGEADALHFRVFVALAIPIISGVRVDGSTASAVFDLATNLLHSVMSHFDRTSGAMLSVSMGVYTEDCLRLVSWLLSLQSRCSFWLQTEPTFPDRLETYLRDAIHKGRNVTGSSTDGALFLASHRLRQVHSLLHEEEQRQLASTTGEDVQTKLQEEAQELATLMEALASSRREGWQMIAKSFVFWSPYATKAQVHRFLRWITTTVASSPNTTDASGSERDHAMALVNDASFFECMHVQDLLLDVSVQLVYYSIHDLSSASWPAPDAVSNMRSCEEVVALYSFRDTNAPDELQRTISLRGLGHLLETVSVLPLKHASMESLLMIHILDITLAGSTSTETSNRSVDMVRLLTSIKAVLNCMLDSSMNTDIMLDSADRNRFFSRHLASQVKAYTLAVFDTAIVPRVVECTESVTRFYSYRIAEPTLISRAISDALEAKCVVIARAILHGLQTCSNAELVRSVGVHNNVGQLWSSGDTFSSRRDVFNFVGDLISMQVDGSVERDERFAPLRRVAEELVEELSSTPGAELSLATDDADYFLASVAQSDTVHASAFRIAQMCAAAGTTTPLIDTAFCKAIAALDADDLVLFCRRVLDQATRRPVDSHLRCLALLVDMTTEESEDEAFPKVGEDILRAGLHSLRLDDASQTGRCTLAASLVVALLHRSDILQFREQEASALLVCAVRVLSRQSHDILCTDTVFSAVSNVVLTLMRRYPKQLYSLGPLLMSFFVVAMQRTCTASLESESIQLRARVLSRLYENLIGHKEIFKKHVIGVILELVGLSRDGLSSHAKEAMQPASFSLLECLSSYELKQLNALLDTQGKAVFRAMHLSYSKLHSFKGQ